MSHLSFKHWWKGYYNPSGFAETRPRKVIAKAAFITGMKRCCEIVANHGSESKIEFEVLTKILDYAEKEIKVLEEHRPFETEVFYRKKGD